MNVCFSFFDEVHLLFSQFNDFFVTCNILFAKLAGLLPIWSSASTSCSFATASVRAITSASVGSVTSTSERSAVCVSSWFTSVSIITWFQWCSIFIYSVLATSAASPWSFAAFTASSPWSFTAFTASSPWSFTITTTSEWSITGVVLGTTFVVVLSYGSRFVLFMLAIGSRGSSIDCSRGFCLHECKIRSFINY